MLRAQSNQPIGANIRSATTGAPWTSPVTVYIKGDLNAQFQASVAGGIVTPNAQGYAEYVPLSTETDFAHIAFTFDAAGAIGATVQVETISAQQLSSLQTASGLLSAIVSDLLQEALFEIRVARAGDSLEPELQDFALKKLNRLLDRWNADSRATYTVGFTSYTPIPNHQPHTLGPSSADWTTLSRPVKLLGANLILNTSPPAIRIPLTIRDWIWWKQQTVQGLATTIQTDLYYEPDWPNASVFLWPIPTATYPIELVTDSTFAVVAATDTLWLPYGYRDALTLTLAEELAPGCGQTVSPSTAMSAMRARNLIFANNDECPSLSLDTGGVPSLTNAGRYLYRTGRNRD